MANRFARKTGNWNASDVWSDTPSGVAGVSFIPVAGDVAMSNSFTVTVNVDSQCAEVRNDTTGGATTGGKFTLADGVTLTANVYGGASSSNPVVQYTGSASATLVGDVVAGSGINSQGATNTSTGTLNITGNVTGGSSTGSVGAQNTSTGTLNITGTATGGSGATSHGANNASSGTLTLTGDAVGGNSTGHGVNNASTGTLTVTGNATGGTGSAAYGANNASTGTLRVGRAVGNDHGPGYATNNGNPGVFGYGTNSGGQPTTTVGGLTFGAYGQAPIVGRVLFDPNYAASTTTVLIQESTFAQVTFTGPDNTSADPAEADVRDGVEYRFGAKTGTCAVPPAGSVAFGVPVDDTTGTAVLSGGGGGATAQEVWEYTTRTLTDKAGFALTAAYDPAQTAASQASVNAIPTTPLLAASYTAPDTAGIAAIHAKTTNLPASPASAGDVAAVGSAVNALHDFDPASDTVARVTLVDTVTDLTNSPNVPSEADIAAEVWGYDPRTLTSGGGGGLDAAGVRDAVGLASANLDTQLSGIHAKTTNLPASPAAVGSEMTLPSAYDAAKTAASAASVAALADRLAEQVPTGPVVVLPAPGPGQTVAWTMCYDEHGATETGVVIQIKLVQPAGAGLALDGAVIEAVSDGDGLAAAAIPRGAGLRFAARRGTVGPWTPFGGVDADTLALPALRGTP